MARIGIFIGTVYGNSLAVGEEAQTILEQAGHEVVLFDEPELSQWKDYLTDVALVITSTTGQGDLPDNIRELFAGLRDDSVISRHCATVLSRWATAVMIILPVAAISSMSYCRNSMRSASARCW